MMYYFRVYLPPKLNFEFIYSILVDMNSQVKVELSDSDLSDY